MKHAPPTHAQPAVTVVEITDPTAASAGIELIEVDAVQLQPMSLRVRRVIVRLGASAVVLGGVFLWGTIALGRNQSPAAAMKLFSFSISYISVLFLALTVDVLVR